MSIRSPLRKVNVIEGDSSEPLKHGNIIEIVDAPVYEVDPITRKCRTILQQFQITRKGDEVAIDPVVRQR